jgi:hypothetical protein
MYFPTFTMPFNVISNKFEFLHEFDHLGIYIFCPSGIIQQSLYK